MSVHSRPGDCAEAGERQPDEAELPAGLVARRHQDRVHVEPRRQPRDLRDEPRRQRPAADDQQPGDRRHADLVADRQPDRVGVGPHRQPADLHHERRRHRAAKITNESLLRSADLVSGAVQRDRLRLAHRAPASTSGCTASPTGDSTHVTDGIGSNESPAFAPNGRHIAFTSTRNGKQQIFTIARDGNEPEADHAAKATTGIRTGRSNRLPGSTVRGWRLGGSGSVRVCDVERKTERA